MKKTFFRLLIPLTFVFFLLLPAKIFAASINLLADGDNFGVGDQFSVSVKVDSEGVAINASQATLHFPKDVLQVVGVDKTGSIFDFWLQEPAFSNDSGQVSFIGGSASGLSGKSLQIVKITFSAKSSGSAGLTFTDAAVTAADGSGTNVLKTAQGVRFTVRSQGAPAGSPQATPPLPTPVQIKRTPATAKSLPAQPALEAPLYPDPQKWYNLSAMFLVKWDLPSDVSDAATALNQDASYEPSKSEGLFNSKTFAPLGDGIWYAHVRFKNNIGWGPTAHYRISIDTVPPMSFEVGVLEGLSTQNSNPTVNYFATDELAGIDHYSIRVDGGDLINTDKTSLTLPMLALGEHSATVAAQDKAGNITEKSVKFEILPPAFERSALTILGLAIGRSWFIFVLLFVLMAGFLVGWLSRRKMRGSRKAKI